MLVGLSHPLYEHEAMQGSCCVLATRFLELGDLSWVLYHHLTVE